MKKNKILAGISALVMGATMMAGTAMSASATTFTDHDSNTMNGTFYAYWDSDDDGDKEWAEAPYSMGDANIYSITEVAEYDDTDPNVVTGYHYDLSLGEATYTISIPLIGNPSGYISALSEKDTGTSVLGTLASDHSTTATPIYATDLTGVDLTNENDAGLIKYSMTATAVIGGFLNMPRTMDVIFVVE